MIKKAFGSDTLMLCVC